MKTLVLALLTLASFSAQAYQTASNDRIDMQKDFSSLGDNQAVIQRAKALDPKNKYKVVQSRAVDRNMRLEIGGNYGIVAGGDSYYNTQNLGANLDFHINPNWSIGARYYHSYNNLTTEGKDYFNNAASNAAANQAYRTPAIDYPIDTTLAVVNWYPIYGKLNLFDMGVSHFDLYLQAGYGIVNLSSGQSNAITGGGGFAFWWTNWLASRLEFRYQSYTDHPYYDQPSTSSRQVGDVVGMASLGIML